MFCWKCGVENKGSNRISFRALCEKCDMPLHSCKNCKYYKPGAPNDCAVLGTEPISDREATNFCEEFVAKEGKSIGVDQSNAKKKFDDLFS